MKLEYKILEFIAKNKYLSRTLCAYVFPGTSQSHIEKTLKNLIDKTLLCRKMLEHEPIKQGREYVYYLSKKGAQKILYFSDFFADTNEMNFGTGNILLIYHDLSVAWLVALWQRQSDEYKNVFFDEITFESRRNFLKIGQDESIIPDVLITTHKNGETKKYFVEIDNFSVQQQEWKKKCIAYQEFLKKDQSYLLIITTKYNINRLFKLLKIAKSVSIRKEIVFGTSLNEIYQCTYLANIWFTDIHLSLVHACDPVYLNV